MVCRMDQATEGRIRKKLNQKAMGSLLPFTLVP
jgi:hypothetical protein